MRIRVPRLRAACEVAVVTGVLASAASASAATASSAARPGPRLSGSEELPPSTFGLWLGIGLVGLVMVAVGLLVRRHGRRRRLASVGPSDPVARSALTGCAEIFAALEPAYARKGETHVDGPIRFSFAGLLPAGPCGALRAAVQVQGRLGAGAATGMSAGRRRGLVALAAVILAVTAGAFIIAPAPRRGHGGRRTARPPLAAAHRPTGRGSGA